MTLEKLTPDLLGKFNAFMEGMIDAPYYNSHERTGLTENDFGPDVCRYVLINEDEIIGLGRYHRQNNNVVIGYILNPQYRGLGLARSIIRMLLVDAKQNKYEKALAQVNFENYESVALLIKLDFRIDHIDEHHYFFEKKL